MPWLGLALLLTGVALVGAFAPPPAPACAAATGLVGGGVGGRWHRAHQKGAALGAFGLRATNVGQEGERLAEVARLNKLLEEKMTQTKERHRIMAEKRNERKLKRLQKAAAAGRSHARGTPGTIPSAESLQIQLEGELLWEQLPSSIRKRLTFVETLGKGSFGSVFLAMDKEAEDGKDKRVAVKVVHAREGEQPIVMREGIVLSLINSPYIPSCYDYGIAPRRICWFVIDYVEGKTLQQILDKSGPLPLRDVVMVALATLEALISVHATGFLHRDVKPTNIMKCTELGSYRLIDFGTATGADGCLFGYGSDDAEGSCFLRSPGEDTLKTLKAVFDSVGHADGFLDTTDLAQCYKAVGVKPSEEQLDELVAKYDGKDDSEADGRISFEEFAVMFGELVDRQDSAFPSGTHGYMPPEQYSDEDSNLTPASEVYSLGVTLFKLLTGRLPFEAVKTKEGSWFGGLSRDGKSSDILDTGPISEIEKERQLWRDVVSGEHVQVPDLRAFTDQPLPESFVKAVETCLAKDPMQRFESAEEAQAAFQAVLQEIGADDRHLGSGV